MYYKIKVSQIPNTKGITTYFTNATNFGEAGYKIIQLIGTEPEIEEIKLMKNIKPSINDIFDKSNKLYIIKIAEDILQDDNTYKTIKYELPVFANDSNQLHEIINKYLSQGLSNMRLTTISETKWIYIN